MTRAKIKTIDPKPRFNYDFGSMKKGEKRQIKTKKGDRDRTLYNLRSAASREKKNLDFDIKCSADDTTVYYQRIERTA